VASTIERIVEVYRAEREDGERFIETIRRIGVKPFKEGAYATHSQAA
jgi:sulfite reductase (NADPH) hemoprotein beta-component